MNNIYDWYLAKLLRLAGALTTHVYKLSGKWDGSNVLKYHAACNANEALIEHHGYHRCPICRWAMEQPGEHIAQGIGHYCHDEAFNERYGMYPMDDVDGVPAHMLKSSGERSELLICH